jgi:hypothetical protein
MAEATQRLQQDKLHASMGMATPTLALQAAMKAAKHQLQAQGLRPTHFSHRDLVIRAEAYLADHREELIAEAKEIVERWRGEGFFGKRCSLGVHSIENAMDDLIACESQEGGAQYLLTVSIYQDFHKPRGLTSRFRATDAFHRQGREQRRLAGLANLGFRHADAAQWRIDVERVGGDAVADASPIVVEEVGQARSILFLSIEIGLLIIRQQ